LNVLYPKVSGSGEMRVSIPLANYNSDILQIVQSYNLLPNIEVDSFLSLFRSEIFDSFSSSIWGIAPHNSCLRSIFVTASATHTSDASGNQKVQFDISFEYSDFEFDSGLWEKINQSEGN